MKNIHILFKYFFSNDFNEFDYDIIGAFTSLKKATEAIEKLAPETETTAYDILSMPINKIVNLDARYEEIDDLKTSERVEALIERGLVEPLVGEDGQFYFVSTDAGKKLAEEKKKENGGE